MKRKSIVIDAIIENGQIINKRPVKELAKQRNNLYKYYLSIPKWMKEN